MSLSDFVTYNMAVMDLIGVSGYTISICGGYANLPVMMSVGFYIGAFPWCGQMSFPILSCMERYLAVVHPITYLRLRQVDGVRIRNISTGIVWLECFSGVGICVLLFNYPEYSLIPSASLMAFVLIAVIFCSLSIVYVLIRPRPGEVGGHRVRVHQSKQRAFHTIIIITGVLLLRFGGNLVCNVMSSSPTVSYSAQCVARAAAGWFNLPSSLVLPLLFLHRNGKLPGCKHNTESGWGLDHIRVCEIRSNEIRVNYTIYTVVIITRGQHSGVEGKVGILLKKNATKCKGKRQSDVHEVWNLNANHHWRDKNIRSVWRMRRLYCSWH